MSELIFQVHPMSQQLTGGEGALNAGKGHSVSLEIRKWVQKD